MEEKRDRVSSVAIVACLVLGGFLAFLGGTTRTDALAWTQTSRADFEAGSRWNVDAANDPGNVTLTASRTDWIPLPSPVLQGPPGSWDAVHASPGTVLLENDVYRMWFHGVSGSGVGAIGLATSTNGRDWTEYPGNPILSPSEPWEGINVIEPTVVREANGSYGLWYRGGVTGSGRVGHAWSPDGIAWNRWPAPVLAPAASWDSDGVFHPFVLRDAGIYRLWYTGFGGDTVLRTGYAESADGVAWTPSPFNPLPLGGPAGSWDVAAYGVHVVREGSGFRMWYVGCSNGPCSPSDNGIGLATSTDGVSWAKHPNNPVLRPRPGSWFGQNVDEPAVLEREGVLDLYFAGCDGSRCSIGLATAAYGARFVKGPSNPVLDVGPVGSWDADHVYGPSVVQRGGAYHLWYSGESPGGYFVGHATSTDGHSWTRDARSPVLRASGWFDGHANWPTVLWDGADQRFKMWFGASSGGTVIGYAASIDGADWEVFPSPVLNSTQPWETGHVSRPYVLGDSSSGFKMWYSGGLDPSRIGYAYSSDGVAWTPHPTANPVLVGIDPWESGSVREPSVYWNGTGFWMWYRGGPHPGASSIGVATSSDGLTWSRSPRNPVLIPGAASSWDDTGVESPDVVKEGDAFRMWFHGVYHVSDIDRIGHAFSPDGVNWTKQAVNPVLTEGESGDWDDHSLMSPAVLKEGSTYRTWYKALGVADLYRSKIGYAESPDGRHWTKRANPVFLPNASNSWESYLVEYPSVLKAGGLYHMWYVGAPDASGGLQRIGHAVSTDGLNWNRTSPDPTLELGDPGEWDDAATPTVAVISRSGTYHMWFTGRSSTSSAWNNSIGHASSLDGSGWTKDGGNPVLQPGPTDSWDGVGVFVGDVVESHGVLIMSYFGYDGLRMRTGTAHSLDGMHWTKSALNPILDVGAAGVPDAWDSASVFDANLLEESGAMGMWYTGCTTAPFWGCRLGVAGSSYWSVGTLESSVHGGGLAATTWNAVHWNATLPPNTHLSVATRSGNTPNPDASWSAWSAETDVSGSAITSPPSRYIQYRATLVSLDALDTPVLHDVTIDYAPPPNTPPTVTITSPVGGETWYRGSTHAVTWAMEDAEDVDANLTVFLNYSYDGGANGSTIATLTGGAESYDWALPAIEADDVVVNVTVVDRGGLKGWDESGPFTIRAPTGAVPVNYWWLAALLAGVAVLFLLIFALWRRRKRRRETEEAKPNEVD